MIIADFIDLFNEGKGLENSNLYANSAAATGAIAAFLITGVSIAKSLGYDFGITDEQMTQIAGGIASIVLVATNVIHVIANKNAGLKASTKSDVIPTDTQQE